MAIYHLILLILDLLLYPHSHSEHEVAAGASLWPSPIINVLLAQVEWT